MKLKYLNYLLGLVLMCAQAQSMDDNKGAEISNSPSMVNFKIERVEVTKLSYELGDLSFRSITVGDETEIAKLIDQCEFKEGLPGNAESWAKNLITRQLSVGNPYSGLMVSKAAKPVGFLTLGFMPAVGLSPGYILNEHQVIIKTFLEFGAIKLKEKAEENATHAPQVYDQVDNGGLGMLLPILPRTLLSENEIRSVLQIGVSAFQTLKDQGKRLPRIGTIPDKVMGLFHPSDPLVKDLETIGFKVLVDDGFSKFYDKPRVLPLIRLK
jgi:hypothetical protein